ncbi:hypothetical protein SDC9_138849 [bioreactor metagenome]|uniref:Uncharacterized protein n=1 Tax=bioreactor metagenome TaxID=1076179 RepID=A0A645DQW0_9ZZZZ
MVNACFGKSYAHEGIFTDLHLAAGFTDTSAAVADLLYCKSPVLGDEDCIALIEQFDQGVDHFTFCLCWHSISPPVDFVIGCQQKRLPSPKGVRKP